MKPFISGNLTRDIEAIYGYVRGETKLDKPNDVRNALKEASVNSDRAELGEVMSPDSLRIH